MGSQISVPVTPNPDQKRSMTNDPLNRVFHGGGRMGERMRGFDWSKTPVGTPQSWPAALKTLVEIMLAAKQPMFTVWGPARTLLYNDSYMTLLGSKDPTALGRSFLDVWDEARVDLVPLVERAFAGEPVHMDLITLQADRGHGITDAHFSFSYTPIRDETGTVAGFFCPCSDTTELVLAERRQAFRLTLEDALLGAEDAQSIVGSAVQALGSHLGASRVGYGEVQADDETIVLTSSYVSGVAPLSGRFPMTGFGKVSLERHRAGETVVVPDILLDADFQPEVFAAIGTQAFVSVPLIRSGQLRACLFVNQAVPRRWTADEVKLIQGVATRVSDAVERLHAEAALRESEAHLTSLFQQNGAGFAELAENGRFLSVNDQFCAMAGRTREALLTMTMGDITHPDSGADSAAALRRVVGTGVVTGLEKRLLRPDGTSIWVANTKSLIGSVKGARTVLTVAIDITARKQIESDLVEAKFAAEEANVAKSTFIANMSHELRTPLSAIIGYSEMMLEEAEDGGEASALIPDLNKVEGNARHLLGLINDVLDLSKIESGKMEVFAEDFDVEPMLRDVAATIDTLVGRKSNRLVLEIDPGVGAMHSDVTKIRQMLLNLLSNAAKFTENGTITLSASRLQANGRDELSFKVADTGIGLTEDQRARLFQRFQQADASTTRKFGGTGLGLSLTKIFAGMLGGDVEVDSLPGHGSTFTVRVPALYVEPQAEEPDADAAAAPSPASKETVLVIDDDADQRALMTRFLQREGFQARTAPDGETGLASARSLKPRAILLDVMMPGVDGWSVLSALKADPDLSAIPVVMVTFVDQRGLASTLGAADYVLKPVNWDRFKAVMDRFREVGNGVLLVDDDADMRHRMRVMLERDGWSVAEAANGEEGLSAVVANRPKMVVLDLTMPVMDGFVFFEKLRAMPEYATVPVVVLSSLDLTREQRRRLCGATQILNKGHTDLSTLVEKLGSLTLGVTDHKTAEQASGRSDEPPSSGVTCGREGSA